MRKVLILAYDFPPFNSIGGQRPYSWFKYFKEFGIEPVVITRLWDIEIKKPTDYYRPSIGTQTVIDSDEHGTVVRTPFRPNLRDRLMSKQGKVIGLVRKALTFLQIFSEHHFLLFGNKQEIYLEAQNYLKSNDVDMIVATGEPFVLFSYAKRLSKQFNIPWIADYRDGWSTNNNLDFPSFKNKLLKRYFKSVEKSVVGSTSLITTAAPDFSARIGSLMNQNETKVPVIYNGFFDDLYASADDVPLQNEFTIVHAGTIYPYQRLETFLEGLNLFHVRNPGKSIKTKFYGLNMFPDQIERIQRCTTSTSITFTDKVSHQEIIRKLISSHLQLLLASSEVNQIYAKVFDYLATGRPILMVENDNGPLEKILEDRPNATICSTAKEVSTFLEEIYDNDTKQASFITKDDTFTRRNQTKRFANFILQIIEENEIK